MTPRPKFARFPGELVRVPENIGPRVAGRQVKASHHGIGVALEHASHPSGWVPTLVAGTVVVPPYEVGVCLWRP